jgi:toxin YoeB
MNVTFLPEAWDDYCFWVEQDKKTLRRINKLIEECRRHPHTGIGKPEPLRHDRAGWWSRRITDEHRLVYRVVSEGAAQQLQIAQCRHHY